jgi:hypothetical protein
MMLVEVEMGGTDLFLINEYISGGKLLSSSSLSCCIAMPFFHAAWNYGSTNFIWRRSLCVDAVS